MKNPTITDAKTLCGKLGARGVIVLAFDRAAFASSSYGETRSECSDMGKLLDEIVRQLAAGQLDPWAGVGGRTTSAADPRVLR